jgi:hypothetical protein
LATIPGRQKVAASGLLACVQVACAGENSSQVLGENRHDALNLWVSRRLSTTPLQALKPPRRQDLQFSLRFIDVV